MANEAAHSQQPMFATTPDPLSNDAGAPPPRSLHLMLPTLSPERRQKILDVHHQAAAVLSRAMSELLSEGDRLFFEGLSFAGLPELRAAEEAGSFVAAFTLETPKAQGLMIAHPNLTAYFARAFLGRQSRSAASSSHSPLTRLERSLAANTLKALIDHLAAFYAGIGLHGLRCTSTGEPLASAARFDPGDCLASFSMRLGATEPATRLTIAVGVELLAAFQADATVATRVPAPTPAVVLATAAAPLDAAIVLGSWTLTLAELTELRIGDTIVLPDGDDAWLTCSGVRLQNVRLDFTRQRVRALSGGNVREVPHAIQHHPG